MLLSLSSDTFGSGHSKTPSWMLARTFTTRSQLPLVPADQLKTRLERTRCAIAVIMSSICFYVSHWLHRAPVCDATMNQGVSIHPKYDPDKQTHSSVCTLTQRRDVLVYLRSVKPREAIYPESLGTLFPLHYHPIFSLNG